MPFKSYGMGMTVQMQSEYQSACDNIITRKCTQALVPPHIGSLCFERSFASSSDGQSFSKAIRTLMMPAERLLR